MKSENVIKFKNTARAIEDISKYKKPEVEFMKADNIYNSDGIIRVCGYSDTITGPNEVLRDVILAAMNEPEIKKSILKYALEKLQEEFVLIKPDALKECEEMKKQILGENA